MSVTVAYWISTSLISAILLWSATTYLFQASVIEGIKALGFPDFFRIQLAVLKILGVIVLLLPNLPVQLKEWAYAGIGLFFITAIVAHVAHKDPLIINVLNVLFILILVTSYMCWHRL